MLLVAPELFGVVRDGVGVDYVGLLGGGESEEGGGGDGKGGG